jgi:hypothetical protein
MLAANSVGMSFSRFTFASLLFVLGCTSTTAASDAPPGDAVIPTAPPPDVTTTPTPPPAPPSAPSRPDGRRLTKLSGPVLANPVVVPIFWGDDPDRAGVEAMLAQLPGSSYWKLLAEYGVGDVKVQPSVTVAPISSASFSLNDVEATLAPFLADADGTQIYALMIPKATSVTNTDGSPFCNSGYGYHESAMKGAVEYSYAVSAHCDPTVAGFTVTVTHELIEAATDPLPLTKPAWAGTDPGHVGFRGEIGDLCDFGGSLRGMGAPMFGTKVERVFSNTKAAKGGDPCLPDIGLPYFDAAPIPSDDVTVSDFVLGSTTGRGVKVPVGKSKKIPLVLYADRDVPEWTVNASAIANMVQESTSIKATLDRQRGKAGDVLVLTVQRVASSGDAGDLVLINSIGDTAQWFDTLAVSE